MRTMAMAGVPDEDPLLRQEAEAPRPPKPKGALNDEGTDDSVAQEMRLNAAKRGMSEDDYSARVATGKILRHLMHINHDKCGLQLSVYDAAFVMPQICRSGGWPRSLDYLVARSYMFLFGNFALQLFILYMIAQEEQVMDKFAGQMYLCNFGAYIETCPDGPNCIGPGGTNFVNAGRMYDYNSWVTRTFVRDSLKALFPEKAKMIQESIDPGEYGLENYHVRFVCVFIFMLSVMSDLKSTLDMIYICWCVPSKAEPWIQYDVPTWANKEYVKEVLNVTELDFVKFRIKGIPLRWKVINVLVIIFPKMFIWVYTAKYGVMFLMETAGIEDVIVNVTALTFILNLDEMLFYNFSHAALHHILENLKPWVVEDTEGRDHTNMEQSFEEVSQDSTGSVWKASLLPYRLFITLGLTCVFIFQYYNEHCVHNEKGGLVSKSSYLPDFEILPLSTFFMPWVRATHAQDAYWDDPLTES